jgi:hypothetical protein
LALVRAASGGVLPGVLDIAIWTIAVFLVLVRLAYNLELNLVKGYYRLFASIGLLVVVCSLAIGVCLSLLGFVPTIGLVPISFALLIFSVLFAPDFFNTGRNGMLVRVVACGLICGLLIGLVSFVF